ncbi:MAG TPA: hypothetical protein VMY37_15955, partial [Thermoguttaceae bacterium]|nr:hypothetical protein [Thermoguttaceae bacterium]
GDGENVQGGPAGTEPGNDEIYGHEGYDYIYGGDGHDDLFGEEDGAYIAPGAGDDIVDGLPSAQYPQVDLVADVNVDDDFDAFYGSDDNREENGFFGGKKLLAGGVRHRIDIYVHHNSMDLTGYGLRLDNSDSTAVEIWDSETGGQLISTPVQWTIGDPGVPASVYLQGIESGGTALTLTVLDGNNPVVGRPLPDYMMVIVETP